MQHRPRIAIITDAGFSVSNRESHWSFNVDTEKEGDQHQLTLLFPFSNQLLGEDSLLEKNGMFLAILLVDHVLRPRPSRLGNQYSVNSSQLALVISISSSMCVLALCNDRGNVRASLVALPIVCTILVASD